ncbi:Hypothetical protein I595_1155 [Croceitalea dokdonensis DOKDO 023]|uniref:Lipoprotein n=1 Tax=Croceitalea dokdonensis DOKDO 023 TaxID=1300341 RepID=A0A0P7ALG9_9FLAO|nr:hypothetical protein [Croceitalea dokdonensis]KPM32728.1 Hypothetical protein I595_1155 [Croceitalea dokdonensis DOKDO 023]
MKDFLTVFLASFFLISCQGQEDDKKNKELDHTLTEEPKGNWRVLREFDDAGNLIRYDSTYSWSYSEGPANFKLRDGDSIFKSFRSQISKGFTGMADVFGDGLSEQDSLFMKPFFSDDFFENQFGKDFMDLDNIRQRMEAIQRRLLERHHLKLQKNEAPMDKI